MRVSMWVVMMREDGTRWVVRGCLVEDEEEGAVHDKGVDTCVIFKGKGR